MFRHTDIDRDTQTDWHRTTA